MSERYILELDGGQRVTLCAMVDDAIARVLVDEAREQDEERRRIWIAVRRDYIAFREHANKHTKRVEADRHV